MTINKTHLTQNYYALNRGNGKRNLVVKFDEDRFVSLVKPLIDQLADQLYDVVNGLDGAGLTTITNDVVNDQFMYELAQSDFFRTVVDKPGWADGLTNALIKLQKRLFAHDGHNDEKFIFQSQIHEWLEQELARVVCADERFRPYPIILKLLRQTSLLYGFYNAFKECLPDSWIYDQAADWTHVDEDAVLIERAAMTMGKEYFQNIVSDWQQEPQKESYHAIKKAARNSEYAMYNYNYAFRSGLLLKRDIKLWLQFWAGLKYPALQDIAFHYIDSVAELDNILETLISFKDKLLSSKKQLAYLVLKNYFDKSLKISQNLDFYCHPENWPAPEGPDYDEILLSEGASEAGKWRAGLQSCYEHMLRTAGQILTQREIADWFFTYKPQTHGAPNYQSIQNEELEALSAAFRQTFETRPEDLIKMLGTDLNFQKLDYLTKTFESSIDEGLAEQVLTKLSELLSQPDFYWDQSFSQVSWPALKSLGWLLSRTKEPVLRAKEMLLKFTTFYEGWNVKTVYDTAKKEIFILCGACLLLEHESAFPSPEDRTAYFNELLDKVISQTRFANYNEENYYLAVSLFSLIVDQILPDKKLLFEQKLLSDLDQFTGILKSLSSKDYQLLPESRIILQQRIDQEWSFERRKMQQRGQRQELDQLEQIITQLTATP